MNLFYQGVTKTIIFSSSINKIICPRAPFKPRYQRDIEINPITNNKKIIISRRAINNNKDKPNKQKSIMDTNCSIRHLPYYKLEKQIILIKPQHKKRYISSCNKIDSLFKVATDKTYK